MLTLRLSVAILDANAFLTKSSVAIADCMEVAPRTTLHRDAFCACSELVKLSMFAVAVSYDSTLVLTRDAFSVLNVLLCATVKLHKDAFDACSVWDTNAVVD